MNYKAISERLKNLRIQKKITQEELANKLFVTRQAISRWEKEKSLPDYPTLELLAKYYNVTIDYILFGKKVNNNSLKELYIDYINNLDKNNKRKTILITIAVILLFIFSIYNMIIYYGKVKVYEFNYDNEKFSCLNSYMYLTNDYSFFKTCDIKLYDPDEVLLNYEYYITNGNNKKLVIGFSSDSKKSQEIPSDNINFGELVNFRMSDEILERKTIYSENWNLQLIITTNKSKYEYIINKNRLYKNNGIINTCTYCKY